MSERKLRSNSTPLSTGRSSSPSKSAILNVSLDSDSTPVTRSRAASAAKTAVPNTIAHSTRSKSKASLERRKLGITNDVQSPSSIPSSSKQNRKVTGSAKKRESGTLEGSTQVEAESHIKHPNPTVVAINEIINQPIEINTDQTSPSPTLLPQPESIIDPSNISTITNLLSSISLPTNQAGKVFDLFNDGDDELTTSMVTDDPATSFSHIPEVMTLDSGDKSASSKKRQPKTYGKKYRPRFNIGNPVLNESSGNKAGKTAASSEEHKKGLENTETQTYSHEDDDITGDPMEGVIGDIQDSSEPHLEMTGEISKGLDGNDMVDTLPEIRENNSIRGFKDSESKFQNSWVPKTSGESSKNDPQSIRAVIHPTNIPFVENHDISNKTNGSNVEKKQLYPEVIDLTGPDSVPSIPNDNNATQDVEMKDITDNHDNLGPLSDKEVACLQDVYQQQAKKLAEEAEGMKKSDSNALGHDAALSQAGVTRKNGLVSEDVSQTGPVSSVSQSTVQPITIHDFPSEDIIELPQTPKPGRGKNISAISFQRPPEAEAQSPERPHPSIPLEYFYVPPVEEPNDPSDLEELGNNLRKLFEKPEFEDLRAEAEPKTNRDKVKALSKIAVTKNKSFTRQEWNLGLSRLENIEDKVKDKASLSGNAFLVQNMLTPYFQEKIINDDILKIDNLPRIRHDGRLASKPSRRATTTTGTKGLKKVSGVLRGPSISSNKTESRVELEEDIEYLTRRGFTDPDEDDFFQTALRANSLVNNIFEQPGDTSKSKTQSGKVGGARAPSKFKNTTKTPVDDVDIEKLFTNPFINQSASLPSAGLVDWSALWNEPLFEFPDIEEAPATPSIYDWINSNEYFIEEQIDYCLQELKQMQEPSIVDLDELEKEFERLWSGESQTETSKSTSYTDATAAADISRQTSLDNHVLGDGKAEIYEDIGLTKNETEEAAIPIITSPLTDISDISIPDAFQSPISETARLTFHDDVNASLHDDVVVLDLTADGLDENPLSVLNSTEPIIKTPVIPEITHSTTRMAHERVEFAPSPAESGLATPIEMSPGSKKRKSPISMDHKRDPKKSRSNEASPLQNEMRMTRNRSRQQQHTTTTRYRTDDTIVSNPNTQPATPAPRGRKRRFSPRSEANITKPFSAPSTRTTSCAGSPQSIVSEGRRSLRSGTVGGGYVRRSSGVGNTSYTDRYHDTRGGHGEGEGDKAGDDDVDMV